MSIVVVAKCPIPGQCKTRLIPLLGPDGAAKLARAMLSDVLVVLSSEEVTATKGWNLCAKRRFFVIELT